jgi:hypothetical protein
MPEDKAEATDSPSAGGQQARSASDHVGTEDSATASRAPAIGGRPRLPVTAPQGPPPEEQARLRTEQSDHLVRFMQLRFPNGPVCPWCGHDDWIVSEVDVLYPFIGQVVAAVVNPVFQVICRTCGHIFLFHAQVAGAMDAEGALIPPPYPPLPKPDSDKSDAKSEG